MSTLSSAFTSWWGKSVDSDASTIELFSLDSDASMDADADSSSNSSSGVGSVKLGGALDLGVRVLGGPEIYHIRLQCPSAQDLASGEGLFFAEALDASYHRRKRALSDSSSGDAAPLVSRVNERSVEAGWTSLEAALKGVLDAAKALYKPKQNTPATKNSDKHGSKTSSRPALLVSYTSDADGSVSGDRSLAASTNTGLTQSWGSALDDEDSVDFDDVLVGDNVDFADRFPKWHERLQVHMVAANAQLGADLVKLRSDTGLVTVTIPVQDLLSDTLASALNIHASVPLMVTLDYSPRGQFIDPRALEGQLQLPKPESRVGQPGNNDDVLRRGSVVRQAVSDFVEANWERMVVKLEMKQADTRVEFFRTSSGAAQGTADTLKAKDMWKTMQPNAPIPAAPPTDEPPKSKKQRTDANRLRKPFGSYKTGADAKKTLSSKERADLEQLTSMGFDEETCVLVLYSNDVDIDRCVDLILNGNFTIRPGLHQILAMGFSVAEADQALDEASPPDDVDAALALLLAQQSDTSESQHDVVRRPRRADTTMEIHGGLLDQCARAVQAGIPRGGDFGFFAGLLVATRERLRNFTQSCIVCGHGHCCNSNSDKPVVCNQALCMFRYEELGMGVQASNIYLCPFQLCPERYDPHDPVMRALAGGTEATREMDLATLESMYNSKYSFPKYLPHDSIMEFIREGKLAHTTPISKITQVMKPEHVFRFEQKWKELRKLRGDDVVPMMAYHGTAAANLSSILDRGLLVPGAKTGVAHATDTGYWGKGIYVSPNAGLSIGYCRAGSKLLLVSVLMGKTFKCTQLINGQPLKAGYDSHQDPSGNEWILMDEAQVLVCYVVDFGPQTQ